MATSSNMQNSRTEMRGKEERHDLCTDNDSGFSSSSFSSSSDSQSSSLTTSTSKEESQTKGKNSSPTFKEQQVGHSSSNSCDSGVGSSMGSSIESSSSYSRPTPARDMDTIDMSDNTNPKSSKMHSRSSQLTANSSSSGYCSLANPADTTEFTRMSSTPTRPARDDDHPTLHFTGTVVEFLSELCKKHGRWQGWHPVKHIKVPLSPKLLEECRQLLWGQDDSDKEFEALSAARDMDENVVALALFVAKSHKQLNTMNSDRQTVLHIAVQECSVELCRLLITRGADGAIADVWGDTPLHIAAQRGRADVIKALTTSLTKPEVHHPYFRVPYKSLPQDNVQSYNHDGRTPIHLAAQKSSSSEHRAAIRSLVRHARADLDYQRLGDGYSASHIAIDNNDYECLKACLEMGADSEVRNFKSETPQQLAYLAGQEEMVKLCQKHGAGSFQLDYAATEPVDYCEDDDMDVDAEDEMQSEESGAAGGLSHQMEQMTVD